MFFRKSLKWVTLLGFFGFVFLSLAAAFFPIFAWALPITTGRVAIIIFFILMFLVSLGAITQLTDLKSQLKTPALWEYHNEVPDKAKTFVSKMFSAIIWYKIALAGIFGLAAIVGLIVTITR